MLSRGIRLPLHFTPIYKLNPGFHRGAGIFAAVFILFFHPGTEAPVVRQKGIGIHGRLTG
ncbi:hypothetical protein DRW41_06220 [Neobacillus piezotolerans]|uniref:Uncharacterized protein n=1 Tax=Neobacillus piezotolerans TaxID=2259171 RepID=A0A3D8GT94_9BACI|nr:hypothetical protein DRW41_06220 [Neobacillus piezotolerans]